MRIAALPVNRPGIASLGGEKGWPWDKEKLKLPMPIYVMSGILTAK